MGSISVIEQLLRVGTGALDREDLPGKRGGAVLQSDHDAHPEAARAARRGSPVHARKVPFLKLESSYEYS
jgi:hypothetical protein